MVEQTSAEYFRMRAEHEWRRYKEATDPRAAEAHAELASRYEEMAQRLEAKDEARPR